MRLLQVLLAVGFLAYLTAAGPLFSDYEEDEYYDYYDYYEDEEEAAPPMLPDEAEAEPEPEIDNPDEAHHHHHHHHEPPAVDSADPIIEDAFMVPEETGDADEGAAAPVLPIEEFVEDEMLTAEDEEEDEIASERMSTGNENATAASGVIPHKMVPVQKFPKRCTQPPDPGVCRGYFPLFYFDPATSTCLQFVYGGCRGNNNAFTTAKECYDECHPIGFTRGDGQEKDDYLTLREGRGNKIFTFLGPSAALRVDDATLAEFTVRNVYQVEFYFRTDSPHGLVAFLRQTSVPIEVGNRKVQLYVFLRRGHLGVTHIFCHNRETFLMQKGGLQGGNWHSSLVKIDAGTGKLILEVDGIQETFTIKSLSQEPHYGANENATFTSRLWIGGVFDEEMKQEVMVEKTSNFHGCLKKIALMSGETSEELAWQRGLSSSSHRGVTERCRTNCKGRHHNLCSPNSACLEHFDHSTCNCFGSGKDGRRCTYPYLPILTLNSDGHVVHRLYEWMDRVHTYTNLVSMEFRTRYTDSILFYGSAEYPEKQYIAATLTAAGTVYVEANLGGGAVSVEAGDRLHTGNWHTLTLIHQHNRLQVFLNSRLHSTLTLPGEVRYFHLDPDFYFGSAPNLTRTCGLRHDKGTHEGYDCQESQMRYYYNVHEADCHLFNYSGCGGNGNNFETHDACMSTCQLPGLRSMHSFLGCMRNVYINDVSVLWELKEQNKTTRYHGATRSSPITDTCADRKHMVLLTLSTEKAHVNLTNPDPEDFRIAVSFRPTRPEGVVASGYVDVMDTRSPWEIHHDEQYVTFVIHDDVLRVKPNTKIIIGNWQYVEVSHRGSRMVMRVNHKTVSDKAKAPLTFLPSVTLGSSPRQEHPGMVGCVRKVELGHNRVKLRSLVGTDVAQKDVTYDGCRVLGPCERPGACEHGSTCSLDDNDEIICNCTDTGYTGKTCHFSLYQTSCEQYRHMGYNTSGVYKIDIDGNGPFPPTFVRCNFNPLTGITSTIVENNLPERYEVRGPHLGNLKVDVKYRDFNPKMLQVLISKSESCRQKVTYNCRRSPLKLSTHTWFASPSEEYITKFGSQTPGLCRCKEIGVCAKADVVCNCDAVDGLARSDEAEIRDSKLLPLTSLVFLEDREAMREESEGRITLTPLTCDKKATAAQTVSFSKDKVFLEVPAWREGSLAFSFKTTSSRAIIAYQPAYHPSHAAFTITLLKEKEVEFMYSYHGVQHRHSLHTLRRLNTGAWQQVLIDIHHHQLRFLVNSEQKLIDIEEDANLGVLDGSMFLGGMPQRQPTWINVETEEKEQLDSLKGCIRDLTLNGDLVDLDRYIRAAPLGVSASCQPACNPNPCKNGAKCIENWSSYECVCRNPLAHSGKDCEINVNEDGVTFTTEESMIKYFENKTLEVTTENLLNTTSLLVNFRTHARQGLVLFTYDYLHNFLQLHLASPRQLVLLFNSGKNPKSLTVEATGEVVFNGGDSVQVALDRSSSKTSLSVYTSGTFFNASLGAGLLLLQDDDYEQFPFGESTPLPNMVYYPHSLTRPAPFFAVYLGSANDYHMDVRAEVPGFVGCIRGLQANSVPVLLRPLLDEYPAVNVKRDCSMVCDHGPCLNGGICTEDFLYPSNFLCNCTNTSYAGPVCSSETAYTFHGNEWLSRDAPTSPLTENMVLELAFSASVRHPRSQAVALLRSSNTDTENNFLLVAVDPDGAVVVRAWMRSLEPDAAFVAKTTPAAGINAFSGNRHAVRVEWRSAGLIVTVDRMVQDVMQEGNIMSWAEVKLSPRGLYLGGIEEGIDSRLLDYDNFHGCISNVMISNAGGKVYPLQEYQENDLHITSFGRPKSGSCAGFPIMPAMVMMYQTKKEVSPVKGGEWNAQAAQREAYAAPPPFPSTTRNTSMDNVVPAVATTVLLVAGVILAILCVRTNSKRKKAKKEALIEEEKEALLLKQRKKSKEESIKARLITVSEVQATSAKPTQNGAPKVQGEVTKMNEINRQQSPPTEPPPPIPSQKPEDKEVEIRTPKDSTVDRPLSWDKSADTLPLIIGTQQEKPQAENVDSSSEGSSFDCTIDITGSPSSSAVFPPHREMAVADSPSSMRVHRGSSTHMHMDEDTDTESEPRLLRQGSLNCEDEVMEPPVIAKQIHLLGDGQVQKIVKSEDENEIVVVDDYLEDKTEAAAVTSDNIETSEDADLTEGNQLGKSTSRQKESDLVEAAQENNQMEGRTQTEPDQASESVREEKGNVKEREETEDKQADQSTEVEKTDTGAEQKPNEGADPVGDEKKRSGDTDSDDDFIELRPETENVQDAERVNSQLN